VFTSLATRLTASLAVAVAVAVLAVVTACRMSNSAAAPGMNRGMPQSPSRPVRRPGRFGLLMGLAGLAAFLPAANRSAESTETGQPGASQGPPGSARTQRAARDTEPSPFAVTARPDPEPTGAVIRRVRLGWHQAGHDWRYEDVSRDQWEIVCRDCGDDEGPPQRQTADVRLLRRPVIGRPRAQTALQHHLDAHRQAALRRENSRTNAARPGAK